MLAALPALTGAAIDLSKAWEEADNYNGNLGYCNVKDVIPPTSIGYVVVKGGNIVAESYNAPWDMYNHTAGWSTTKSWTSFLIGTLVDRGLLSLNSTLGDIFDDPGDWINVHEARKKRGVRLQDMLTMTSGLVDDIYHPSYWVEAEQGVNSGPLEVWDEALIVALNLGKSQVWARTLPQETWNEAINYVDYMEPVVGSFVYCIACHLLGQVVQKVTGLPPYEYALHEPMHLGETFGTIFEAMGITEDDVTWNGTTSAFGIFTSPRIMAKLGTLFLQKGMASEVTRVVSHEWVDDSSTDYNNGQAWGSGYGYQWWLDNGGPGSYCAAGAGGQMICVYDDLDAVIALTTDNNDADGFETVYQLYNELVAGTFDVDDPTCESGSGSDEPSA